MSEQESVDVTLEQMFAAVLNTVGKVAINRESLLKDYGSANIRIEEIDRDTVTFELYFGGVEDDIGTIGEDGS